VISSTGRLSVALADRYRIERELGAGGMATVYLAADLSKTAGSPSRS
jgi:serine/threonine-protein kinase